MIIVTGGTGFIGSNLVEGLEARGFNDIVICDTLGTDEKWRNIAKREIRDIVHPDRLFDYLERHQEAIEAIFHLGAISATTEKDADLIVETNIVLSRRLWKWCGKHNKRIIYASSAATYGDGAQGFTDYETTEELKNLLPLNAYGWSKHVFDRRVARVLKTKSEPIPRQWAGLKFFNVYGPNEYHKEDQMSVICKLYPQVKAGATAKLFKSYHPDYEDGGQLRDFVYVKDTVKVMLWLYDNPEVSGLFNVGTGEARSFKALAEATFAAADVEPKIQYMEMPETLKPKYQYYTQAEMTKLREAGYVEDFTSLEDGVKDYVQNYMAEEDPYL
ncbi:MAG: ADP-glyceromanno-heptose 6-epimerase [Pseudomonadota bacterium]